LVSRMSSTAHAEQMSMDSRGGFMVACSRHRKNSNDGVVP